MSLLSDLQLDFEALADDPIEMGIHYGKTVLQVVSSKVSTPKQYFDSFVAPQKTTKQKQNTQLAKSPVAAARTDVVRPTDSSRLGFRRDYQTLAATAYARKRQVVGSL